MDVEHIWKQLACCSFVFYKQKTANSINSQQINENRTENEVQLNEEENNVQYPIWKQKTNLSVKLWSMR